uniref:Uncharacterized protein n=1 Tax=Anabas testudineus TaxID=64144 RepID=A0A3Q1IZL6_ANATE
ESADDNSILQCDSTQNTQIKLTYKEDVMAAVAHLNSSTPAFADSIRHSGTRRVDHGHETNKAKVLSGEVHVISIKIITLWELVIRQVEMAKTCVRWKENVKPRTLSPSPPNSR